MVLPEDEKAYSAYLVNRGLSYFEDPVLLANEMNRRHQLDGRLQYDFLRLVLPKRKRRSRWFKAESDPTLESVAFFHGFSIRDARDAVKWMGPEWAADIHTQVERLRSAEG